MNVDLARWACLDHAPAVMFLAHIFDIAHTADDIADGDTNDRTTAVETLLALTLNILPCDPFYMEHFDRLHPLVTNAITHWAVANRFERANDEKALERGFVLRSMYATLTVACAEIVAGPINGPLWAREVATRVWAEWTTETVADYKAEHLKE